MGSATLRVGGDFNRIDRQQKFLRSLASQMMSRDNLIRSPNLYLSLLSYLETNLSPKETLGLALSVRAAQELNQVYMTTLPGIDMMVDGIYYWKLDQVRTKDIVRQFIFGTKATS